MLSEPVRVANTREHISWSHRFAFFWLVLTLVLFGGAYALAEIGNMAESSRIQDVRHAWQVAGLALARLENVILPRMKAPVSHD